MKKNNRTVYSTDPDFKFDAEDEEPTEELLPEKQVLRLHLERLKGNKEATVVRGFIGPPDRLSELSKTLKNKCAAGGSVRDDGDIIIQGNHREKVLAALLAMGFKNTKKAGG